MNDIDMMVKTVVSRRKMDSIISSDDGVIDGIEYICRLVHDGIIRYSLRELYQRLSEEYIKAQTPSTSPFNNDFSRGVMIACDYWLNIKEKATDAHAEHV